MELSAVLIWIAALAVVGLGLAIIGISRSRR